MHRLLSLKVFLVGFLVSFAGVLYAQAPGFFPDGHAQKTADLPPFSEYEKPTADGGETIQADFQSTIRSDVPAGMFLARSIGWNGERDQKMKIKE